MIIQLVVCYLVLFMGYKDISNMVFGRLTVKTVAGKNKQGSYLWLCLCECGKEKIIVGSDIRRGLTTSCGCYATEKRKEKHLGFGISSRNEIYAIYKKNASKRKLIFDITIEQFESLSKQACVYCGELPKQEARKDFIYNGMDRVDSTKGYNLENVVPCCGICNRAKYTLTVKEFKEWVIKVHANMI